MALSWSAEPVLGYLRGKRDFAGVIKDLRWGGCPRFPDGPDVIARSLNKREAGRSPSAVGGVTTDIKGWREGATSPGMQVARDAGKTRKWILPWRLQKEPALPILCF